MAVSCLVRHSTVVEETTVEGMMAEEVEMTEVVVVTKEELRQRPG